MQVVPHGIEVIAHKIGALEKHVKNETKRHATHKCNICYQGTEFSSYLATGVFKCSLGFFLHKGEHLVAVMTSTTDAAPLQYNRNINELKMRKTINNESGWSRSERVGIVKWKVVK